MTLGVKTIAGFALMGSGYLVIDLDDCRNPATSTQGRANSEATKVTPPCYDAHSAMAARLKQNILQQPRSNSVGLQIVLFEGRTCQEIWKAAPRLLEARERVSIRNI